ncbi:MAG TPA: hypothetical protein VHE83_15290 [Mycobacteriales bacterium]|nr:hypothetical protein [Mycobacteriales bacterium]
MRLRGAAMLLCAGLAPLTGLGAAPASAAAYPPAAIVCSIAPDPVNVGATVTITGTGYKPGTSVTVTVTSNGVVTHTAGTVDPNGSVTVAEQAGPNVGPVTFRVAGSDTTGAAAGCQVTTHATKVNGNGNGNGNGKGNGNGNGNGGCTAKGSLSSDTASVGQTVMLGGGGFAPNSPVSLSDSAGNDLGSTTSDGSGRINAPVAEAQPGTYTVYASGDGAGSCKGRQRTIVAGLNITRAEGAGLPFTGVDGLWLLLFAAIVLVSGGSGVVALERRRRLVRAQR